jgi:hypothetical protein
MKDAIALLVTLVFVGLALWHVRMALRPAEGRGGAIPTVSGKPLFVPSTRATLGVAAALLLFAGLVAATAGLLSIGLPQWLLVWSSYGLAVGLFGRAVGEFKYVGFFKHVRGSRFATLDTLIYSPLCVLLGAGVALVGLQNG